MLTSFFPELLRRGKVLHHFGWIMVGMFFVCGILYFVDKTVIMGINAWIKPMKFALSIAIYSWTFGWLMGYSEDHAFKRRITLGLVITMAVEFILIFSQAARGTTSHFNIHTPLDGMIFGIMGIFILINTLLNAYVLWVFVMGRVTLTGTMLFAWRSGLALLLLGSVSGQWMVQALTHTVGGPDGGPGLPFVNWSTLAGDIRSAHFATLHGLQFIPFGAFLLTRVATTNADRLVKALVLVYFLLCTYLHVLAWRGIPLVSQD